MRGLCLLEFILHCTIADFDCNTFGEESHVIGGCVGYAMGDEISVNVDDEARLADYEMCVSAKDESLDDISALPHEWDRIVHQEDSWNSRVV